MNWSLKLRSSEASKPAVCGCRGGDDECDDVARFWAELTRAWHRPRPLPVGRKNIQAAAARLDPFPAPKKQPQAPSKIDPAAGLVEEWSRVAFQSRRGGTIRCTDARSAFERWCRASGKNPCNANAFGRQMTALGFKRKRKGGHFHYSGIVLTVGLKAVA